MGQLGLLQLRATYPRHGFDHCFFHPLSSWPPGVATEDFSRGAQVWIAKDVCQEAGNAEEMQSWKWPPGDPGKDRMPMLMNQGVPGQTPLERLGDIPLWFRTMLLPEI